MKIPSKIKVLGHLYEVRVNNEPQLGMGACGSCCANLLRIELDPTLHESRQAETFLHQIFEALKVHLELDLKHSDLTALSEGLFSVFRDNKLHFMEDE